MFFRQTDTRSTQNYSSETHQNIPNFAIYSIKGGGQRGQATEHATSHQEDVRAERAAGGAVPRPGQGGRHPAVQSKSGATRTSLQGAGRPAERGVDHRHLGLEAPGQCVAGRRGLPLHDALPAAVEVGASFVIYKSFVIYRVIFPTRKF